MRVFTNEGITIEKPTGGTISWPVAAFAEVDEKLGNEWIKSGMAKLATKDNRIAEDAPKSQPKPKLAKQPKPVKE